MQQQQRARVNTYSHPFFDDEEAGPRMVYSQRRSMDPNASIYVLSPQQTQNTLPNLDDYHYNRRYSVDQPRYSIGSAPAFNEIETIHREEPSLQRQLSQKYKSYRPEKPYCCGWFSTRKSCCCFWISFFVIFLGLLAVAAYFVFPRMPTINIGPPFSPAGSKGLQISPPGSVKDALLKASPERPFRMSIPYAVNISLYSSNYIDIYTSALDLNVFFSYLGSFFE